MVKRGESDHNNCDIGNNNFEKVQEFKNFNTTQNCQNNMHEEINIRLSATNAMKTLFKSKLS